MIGDDLDSAIDSTNFGFIDGSDQVSGYTERQLEDALQSKKSWNIWRDNIKDKYENATEQNLDKLFAHWD